MISTFFFNIMMLFLFLHLVVRHFDQIIFHLKLVMGSHSSVNLCPVSYLKAYLQHAEPLRSQMDLGYPLLIVIGSTCQCVSMISWVRKVLSIARAHMSIEYSLGCCSICSCGGRCSPSVQPAGRSLGYSFYFSYTFFNIYHYLGLVPEFKSACCPGP